MTEFATDLYVGSDEDCPDGPVARIVGGLTIHACKTCHQRAVGYAGNLVNTHPNYLWYEYGADLYLNMIDPRDSAYIPDALVEHALVRIADMRAGRRPVLIHCNKGASRAPMLALLFMNRRGDFGRRPWSAVEPDVRELFPSNWAPGPGVATYIKDHWKERP